MGLYIGIAEELRRRRRGRGGDLSVHMLFEHEQKVVSDLETVCVMSIYLSIYLQGVYQPGKQGKPGKVREFQNSQGKPGKVREFDKNWESQGNLQFL